MGSASGFECSRCGRTFAPDAHTRVCPCGAPLLVRYDLDRLARTLAPDDWSLRPAGMWRYRDLLPLPDHLAPVSLGEGGSPLLRLDRLGADLGLPSLYLKDEGLQPTLTFKARGASLGVSMASTLGFKDAGMSTTGSAGTAWAAYCARAGLRLHLAMPADVPREVREEAERYGAEVHLVSGTIVEAGLAVTEMIEAGRWYNADHFQEPFRLEGKKTLGFEVAEALGWRPPSVVLFPTGGGIGPLGMAKAFDELSALGWIEGTAPRMVVVQAAGCAPVVKAFRNGRKRAEPWPDPHTIAKGIRVPETPADSLLLDLLARTGGTAIAVPDSAILEAHHRVARLEGVSASLEGAAALAALVPLVARRWITRQDTVVVVNSGSGLKPGHSAPAKER